MLYSTFGTEGFHKLTSNPMFSKIIYISTRTFQTINLYTRIFFSIKKFEWKNL